MHLWIYIHVKKRRHAHHVASAAVLLDLVVHLEPEPKVVRVRYAIRWEEVADRAERVEAYARDLVRNRAQCCATSGDADP